MASITPPELQKYELTGAGIYKEWWANPAVVGLMGFALTTMATGLHNVSYWAAGLESTVRTLLACLGASKVHSTGMSSPLVRGHSISSNPGLTSRIFISCFFASGSASPARGDC